MKRTITKISLLISAFALSFQMAGAQSFTEGFDDIFLLNGWDFANMSNPIGTEPTWVQGYSPLANQTYYFTANSGHDSSFICGSFNNTDGAGVISNWLLSPAVNLSTGDNISFWTRSTDLAGTVYPDRMQLWHSTTNSSNVGPDEFSTGDFTNLIVDINSTYSTTDYPFVWTQYSYPLTLTTASVGRFGFRYFVEDGGPSGNNSFIIGIDDVAYTSANAVNQNDKPAAKISTYPNPAVDQITFDFGTALEANAKIIVSNELGQSVMNGQLNKGTKAQIVDISKLASGTYMINVTDENGNNFRSHFAKN